ncbi:MAG: B12-binding domain-containing radical SAM protein [Candidatus Wallbacteria bacterium]|nr:B12-binding domain-containing radical SAM protein [Candidatus Wallbacteria bacterium]
MAGPSKLRILLIQVAREGPDGEVWRPARLWFHGLTLPYLAALFDHRASVRTVDELVEPVPLDHDCDLVGITFMGASLPRALRLADQFRARGRRVIAGGVTASLYADEVLPHVDSLVVGDAEGLIDPLLDDFEKGTPKRVYRHARPPGLEATPVPRYDQVARSKVGPYYPVEATRGCSFGCGFCATSHFHGRVQRKKPVENVLRDVAAIKSEGIRRVLFVDDNVTLDRRYFSELLEGLGGLGVRWTANATADIARDEGLLDRMAASGCESVSIGFETLDQQNLERAGKSRVTAADYPAAVRRLQERGIMVLAMFVLGLDGDGPEVFADVERFLVTNRIEMALFHVLTPVRGTPLFDELAREGRMLDVDFAAHGADRAVFRPARMSPGELDDGFWRLQRRFYSMGSILRRLVLVRPDAHYLRRLTAVAANLYFGHLARSKRLLI